MADDANTKEKIHVITVRLPAELHAQLKAEAKLLGISLNMLALYKLQQGVSKAKSSPEADSFVQLL